jgi:hypothetical protein
VAYLAQACCPRGNKRARGKFSPTRPPEKMRLTLFGDWLCRCQNKLRAKRYEVQGTGTRYRLQGTGTRYKVQVQGTRCKVHGTRHRYKVHDARCKVTGARYKVQGTRYNDANFEETGRNFEETGRGEGCEWKSPVVVHAVERTKSGSGRRVTESLVGSRGGQIRLLCRRASSSLGRHRESRRRDGGPRHRWSFPAGK